MSTLAKAFVARLPAMYDILSYRQLPVCMKDTLTASTLTRGDDFVWIVPQPKPSRPLPDCDKQYYVTCREGHSSFADHAPALRLSFTFIWDLPSRKGEYADIQSLW